MFKSKPSWPLWFAWLIAYTVLDMLLEYLLHGGFAWTQLHDAVLGAIFGATVTWLFALWRWYKADGGF